MSDSQKKQNFLQGTMLLAMATAIVKVIGALYKIPLNAIIGEQGFGYFNTAYEIYNVLLMKPRLRKMIREVLYSRRTWL